MYFNRYLNLTLITKISLILLNCYFLFIIQNQIIIIAPPINFINPLIANLLKFTIITLIKFVFHLLLFSFIFHLIIVRIDSQ